MSVLDPGVRTKVVNRMWDLTLFVKKTGVLSLL